MRSIIQVALVNLIVFSVSPAWADGLCIPSGRGSENLPICAIYMHGLFGSPSYPEWKWEKGFRSSLEGIANSKKYKGKCRIAVPFGYVNKYSGNHQWAGVAMAQMRKNAEAACPGSKMIPKPGLIGFSAGANWIRKAGCKSLTAQYSPILLIGPTNSYSTYRKIRVKGRTVRRKVGTVRVSNDAIKKCAKVVNEHAVPKSPTVLADAIPGGADEPKRTHTVELEEPVETGS